jgi:hypothetical protein
MGKCETHLLLIYKKNNIMVMSKRHKHKPEELIRNPKSNDPSLKEVIEYQDDEVILLQDLSADEVKID